MDDDRVAISSGFVVTPETVASRTFASSFRGFDQGEVRTFLKRVSEELVAAAEREAQLRRLLHEAQNRAAHPEVDEEVLTAALGEQAARLLGSAREQAASIRAEAEAKASRMLRDTEGQISRVRSEADSLLARRVEEVDGVTANLRNAAEADARSLREQAKADAEAEIQAAKAQGREMVTEARAIRERILADLARRRHISEVQLDQLRAARERLLEAYSLVRRTLDEATQELKMAEVEARLAAEEAGRRAGPPPPPPPPPTPPSTGLDVGPITGENEAVSASPPVMEPSPAAAAPRGGMTRVRPQREPSTRSERLRPPSRPDDARPSPPWRRPGGGEPPVRPERQASVPAVAHGGAPAHAGTALPNQGHSSRKATQPEPPSMTPRPVPPPPARSAPRMSPPGATSPPEADTWPLPAPTTGQPRPARPATPSEEQVPAEPGDRVEALFARIKADRASVVAQSSRPPPAGPETQGEGSGTTTGDSPAPAAVPAMPEADAHGRNDIADESARGRRDELLEPIEATLVRQLKRALQDDQNEVLDRLRRERRPTVASVLASSEQQIGKFRDVAVPALADAVTAGRRFVGAEPTGPQSEQELAAAVATILSAAVVEPLRARLERQLETGDGDGEGAEDASQLAESISAAYRQWRAQELEPLARHHAADAFARGAYAAHADGAALRWVVDDDGPCPDCDDNRLAGTVTKGEAYPTGQVHPPAHQGCRCLLVPAVP